MKKLIALLIVLGIVVGAYMLLGDSKVSLSSSDTRGDITVHPVSHATMVLEWRDFTIYTDPVGGADNFSEHGSPDLILLTDVHGDHLDVETLAAVSGDAVIVAPAAVVAELDEELLPQVIVMANGETIEELGFSIEAIPMYNLPESPDSRHVKGRGNGYVVSRDGTRLYIAGDTAGIPEMRALTNIDLAFVPMNLPYTMDITEAADAVLEFTPRIVYPYHYRGEDGLSDIHDFARIVRERNSTIEVVLLDWYPEEV